MHYCVANMLQVILFGVLCVFQKRVVLNLKCQLLWPLRFQYAPMRFNYLWVRDLSSYLISCRLRWWWGDNARIGRITTWAGRNIAGHDTGSILINHFWAGIWARTSIVKAAIRNGWASRLRAFGFVLDFTLATVATVADVDAFCLVKYKKVIID